MRKYAYGWITAIFFLVSIIGHWVFGWYAYLDEQSALHVAPVVSGYVVEMARDTFENWQSEFLQLIWQVVGLAYFLYVGSPASKENDDRSEAKLDELIKLMDAKGGQARIDDIDRRFLRQGGRSPPHGQEGRAAKGKSPPA